MAYITVKGTLVKFHNSGTGFAIEERFTNREGVETKKTWQVFPAIETHGALPGMTITVNGTLSASVYSFQDTSTLEQVHVPSLKVNNAKVTIEETGATPAATESAPF